MSIEKSQFKAAVLHEIGCDFEDQLEAARAELHRTEGRVQFGKLIAEKLRGLQAHLQRDVEEERLAPDDASVRSKQIQTAIHLVTHLTEGSAAEMLTQRGRIDQSERAIRLLKAKHDNEIARADAAKDAALLENAVGPMRTLRKGERPIGVHPGEPLKERRVREEKASLEERATTPPKKSTRRASVQAENRPERAQRAEGERSPRGRKKANSEAQSP